MSDMDGFGETLRSVEAACTHCQLKAPKPYLPKVGSCSSPTASYQHMSLDMFYWGPDKGPKTHCFLHAYDHFDKWNSVGYLEQRDGYSVDSLCMQYGLLQFLLDQGGYGFREQILCQEAGQDVPGEGAHEAHHFASRTHHCTQGSTLETPC